MSWTNPTSRLRCCEAATSRLAASKPLTSLVMALNVNGRRRAKKTKAELQSFAFTVGSCFAIFGGIAIWRHKHFGIYLVVLAGVLLLFGLIAPKLLGPVEFAWMKFAHYLSIVMTFVILTLTFFLVVTPTGLFLRLIRKDLLGQKFDRTMSSYWIKVEFDAPGSRPFVPY